jgi:hypothetical protein
LPAATAVNRRRLCSRAHPSAASCPATVVRPRR